jgi:hypothetical protein
MAKNQECEEKNYCSSIEHGSRIGKKCFIRYVASKDNEKITFLSIFSVTRLKLAENGHAIDDEDIGIS